MDFSPGVIWRIWHFMSWFSAFSFRFRRFALWQITQPDERHAPSVYLDHHFGINHLLFLTAIVALACGLIRSVFTITTSELPYSTVLAFIGSLSLLLVLAFPSSVVPWITLAPGRKPYRLIPIIMLIAGVLDVLALFNGASHTTMARLSWWSFLTCVCNWEPSYLHLSLPWSFDSADSEWFVSQRRRRKPRTDVAPNRNEARSQRAFLRFLGSRFPRGGNVPGYQGIEVDCSKGKRPEFYEKQGGDPKRALFFGV